MKTIYKQKYRKGTVINDNCLPRLAHISRDFYVDSAELLEDGVVELKGGEQKEYQVIKVFIKKHIIGNKTG